MRIQNIQNYNTNFQGLHIDNKYFKQYPKRLKSINNPFETGNISSCADKFEVLVKRGKKLSKKNPQPLDNTPTKFLSSAACYTVAVGGVSIAHSCGLVEPSIPFLLIAGCIGAGVGYLAARFFTQKNGNKEEYEFNLQVGKRVKENPITHKKELVNTLSKKYPVNSWDDIGHLPNLQETAQQRDRQNFMDTMERFNVENLYEPKDILAILNDKDIKQNYSVEEIFDYKLNDENTDTLLTKFFDIVPTEENKKDYDKIIEILKNAENIDYNQIDSNGISIVEKIINSENTKALELVRDFEFNYSKSMDLAYNNIENADFKRKIKRLNVSFPNIREAAKINSNRALNAILPEFASPFCDVAKVLNNIYGTIDLGSFSRTIDFLEENGVDTYYCTLASLEKNGVDTSSIKVPKRWDD